MVCFRGVFPLDAVSVWLILFLMGVYCGENEGNCCLHLKHKKVKKFGCVFQDDNFKLKTDSVFNPVYGEKVKPMNFTSAEQFEEVLEEIENVHAHVMEELMYDNFAEFFDFYDEYKRHYKPRFNERPDISRFSRELREFYTNYVPMFYRTQGTASRAVVLLEKLIERFPNMEPSVHLVTAGLDEKDRLLYELDLMMVPAVARTEHYPSRVIELPVRITPFRQITVPPLKWLRKIRKPVGLHEEPPKILFQHDHVAALLRVLIGGRLGYVLMDPVANVEKPIVIMDDNKMPYMPFSHVYADSDQDWEFHLPRRDYIFARALESSTKKKSHHFFYYISKPFCSFLATTVKKDIIGYIKTLKMMRTDFRGRVTAYLKHYPWERFTRTIFTALRTGNKTRDVQFPINSIQYAEQCNATNVQRYKPIELRNSTQIESAYFQKVFQILDYDGDILSVIKKAKKIGLDADFVQTIQEIGDYLYDMHDMFLSPEPEGIPQSEL